MKKYIDILYVCTALLFGGSMTLSAQNPVLRPQGMFGEEEEEGSHWASDSISKEDVPVGMYGWKIDPRFGDIRRVVPDTLMHHFQNDAFTDGRMGTYHFLGNYGSPRVSRLFFENRGMDYNSPFIFEHPYDFFLQQPGELLYTNTKSPITNLTYHECGNKQNGEDRITALFAVNAGKKLGMGFKLDYLYGRGYYPSQQTAHFDGTVYASYLSERYEMHTQYFANHMKTAENGGIESDDYITRPEAFPTSYSPADMPMRMNKTWNKMNVNTFYLTHRYNLGFVRHRDKNGNLVKTDKDRLTSGLLSKAVDVTRADSGKAQLPDSIKMLAANEEQQDSVILIPEFVPVSSILHTLRLDHNNRRFLSNWFQNENNSEYFADFYLPGDSANDFTKHLHIANTVALELKEGFNKWMKSGLRMYARHDFNRYTLPDSAMNNRAFAENHISIGAQLLKQQGRIFHYNVFGEIRTSGDKWGEFNVEGNADLNIPMFKDTLRLMATARVCNQEPTFYYRHYHSRNAWWDNSLDKEFRTRVGALISYKKTRLSVNLETVQNYAYFAEKQVMEEGKKLPLFGVSAKQHHKNIQLLSVGVGQDFKWGIFHWDNELTYQLTSEKSVLPLPTFNAYTNLYIDFRIAKVLHTEIGADLRYYTKYYAPTYSPMIGQFCVQDPEHRVEVGNYPTVNVYANFHLKRTRFYVMGSHVNYKNGAGEPFLIPHYPMNRLVLRLGVSWNFLN